jgi:gamma-glutamylcysteine synthetase
LVVDFHRIGTEHEKFGFQLDSLQPMTYEQTRKLLDGMAERFDWEKVMEGDNIIGLKFVSLHPWYMYSFVLFINILL